MACVYAPIEENRTAAEVVAGYRAAKSKIWATRRVATVPIAVIPPKTTTTVKQERDFMANAHGLLDLVESMRVKADFLTGEQIFRADAIFDACARVGRCTVTEIKSNRRFRQFVTARMVLYYLARKHTHLSYPAIGRLCGSRDHSSVLHGIRTVEQALSEGREPYASFYIETLAILDGV